LNFSSNIVMMIKSKMRLAGNVARMGDEKFRQNYGWKRKEETSWTLRLIKEDNIRMDVKAIGCVDVNQNLLAQKGD